MPLKLLLALALAIAPSHTRIYSPPASVSNITTGSQATAVVSEATTAAQTLYVDPTGSDANDCTATGASACLTIQGAFNKSPKLLRHQLTVNVAAGSYAGATISGFTVDPGVQRATAGILLDGALANVTPTSGNATGTASAGTAGTGVTFGTLTDAASGTWTVNDAALVGKFVSITGGTGSGQVGVIVSNTATVLTIAGVWTAPDATSTYALKSPSVNITSAAALIPGPTAASETVAAGIQIADNTLGASRVVVRNIGISIAATTGVVIQNSSAAQLTQVVTSTTTAGAVVVNANAGSLTVLTCSFTATTPSVVTVTGGIATISQTLMTSTGSNSCVSASQFSAVTLSASQLTCPRGLTVLGGSQAVFATSRCDCSSAANSTCVSSGGSLAATAVPDRAAFVRLSGNIDVTNCTSGLYANTGQIVALVGTTVISGNALAYAVRSDYGGSIFFPAAVATITGATAQMAVDNGAATGTFASLGAAFACLHATAGSTDSRVCRQ